MTRMAIEVLMAWAIDATPEEQKSLAARIDQAITFKEFECIGVKDMKSLITNWAFDYAEAK